MRYRNVKGTWSTVAGNYSDYRVFLTSPFSLEQNLSCPVRVDKQAKALGIYNLKNYLGEAVRCGNCVIIERDDITFDIICSKLTARVDSQMLECLWVWRTCI